MNDLLPPNATPAERAIVAAIKPDIPVEIHSLWDKDTCPVSFLPFLAKANSVDYWDSTWNVENKKAAIDAAFFIHKHKGTVTSLRRTIEPIAELKEVIQWYKKDPVGVPNTFEIKVNILDSGINEQTYNQLVSLINNVKPLSSHMIGLDMAGESRDIHCYFSGIYDGELVTVYPEI